MTLLLALRRSGLLVVLAGLAMPIFAQVPLSGMQNPHAIFDTTQQSAHTWYSDPAKQNAPDSYWKSYRRWEYFWKSRAGENEPTGRASMKCFEASKELPLVCVGNGAGSNWQSLGPFTTPQPDIVSGSSPSGNGILVSLAMVDSNVRPQSLSMKLGSLSTSLNASRKPSSRGMTMPAAITQ